LEEALDLSFDRLLMMMMSDNFMQDGGFSITALNLEHVHVFNV